MMRKSYTTRYPKQGAGNVPTTDHNGTDVPRSPLDHGIADPRGRARNLIAKQFAMNAGQVYDRLPGKIKVQYQTYASNAIATVERLARKVEW